MTVGAGILSIITESLYDKPIVVFREYVQNSVDAFARLEEHKVLSDPSKLKSVIWTEKSDLFFLDNGTGITDDFIEIMKSIANSPKDKIANIGYKGIGRLSGFSYCQRLELINIRSYKNSDFQKFTLYKSRYDELKSKDNFNELSFEDLMNIIGVPTDDKSTCDEIKSQIDGYIDKQFPDLFEEQDTGFLVVLRNISNVLKSLIKDAGINNELGWLLPVDFEQELYNLPKLSALFEDMTNPEDTSLKTPAKSFSVSFNGFEIKRPIVASKLRAYTCKRNFKYADGLHSFNKDRIIAQKGNDFLGIRVYLDNMLLCDENELIPALQQFGLIEHSAFELIQTVKGIGAMIYITDKVNIVANARRTFIEVSDDASVEFLRYIAEFVEEVYSARYALSKFYNAQNDLEKYGNKTDVFRERATEALQALAKEESPVLPIENENNFNKLKPDEKRRAIKKKINKELGKYVDEFVKQSTEFDLESAYEDFLTWYKAVTQ